MTMQVYKRYSEAFSFIRHTGMQLSICRVRVKH